MMAIRTPLRVNSRAWHLKLTLMVRIIGLVSLFGVGGRSGATTWTQDGEALIQSFVGLHLVSAQTQLTSVLMQLRELLLKKLEGTITTVSFILRLSDLTQQLDEIKDKYRLTELNKALGDITLQRTAESIFEPSTRTSALRWSLYRTMVSNFMQAYFDLKLAISSAQLDRRDIAELRCELADLRLEIAGLAHLLSVTSLQSR
ncbi:MAG: hypothetical protein QXI19_09725 [Candidatus Caldarchaeum sp.]